MRMEIEGYIKIWENRCYSELPDEAPREIDDMVPSYKRIAIAILKNDLSYIGINPPVSEYYGMLKCIELKKEYKKSKTMTKFELKNSIYSLINTMLSKGSYIKGYGNLFRVMSRDHSPIINITKVEMNCLIHNSIVTLYGIIYRLDITSNPFQHPSEVKLPIEKE